MKTVYKLANLIASLTLVVGCATSEPIDYVSPFVGTGFHGHTYPGATTPFGAVQLSPDTRSDNWDACAGYHYSDTTIDGFSHTHLSGTGCADLADILFYPSTVEVKRGQYNEAIMPPHPFSHKYESASPGYYSVDLKESGIEVELTATPRCGVHRYNFKGGDRRIIIIDMMHTVTQEAIDDFGITARSSREVVGMRVTTGWVADQHIYFSAQFSEPIVEKRIVNNGTQLMIHFDDSIESLVAKVGLSIVSIENAQENLAAEVVDFDFDAVKSAAEQTWSEALSVINVEGAPKSELINLYTALYHTMLTPNIVNDVNGQYRRNNGEIAQLKPGEKRYSTLSLWDTFRAWNPLKTLINKELVVDMIDSILDMYDATGELPMWPLSSGETGTMIGYHSVPVIVDAYMRGIDGFDAEKALDAMIVSSNKNKKGSDYYTTLGYIPANIKKESVSCLLEFAYDDWCIAIMADKMGRKDVAATYFARAENFINVFDGSTGFFRGKNLNGSFNPDLNEFVSGRDYTEATPWQYRFFVPHDVNGMIQLFGGVAPFITELDRLFTLESDGEDIGMVDITGLIGQYAHGNEPSHHMAYLYNYVGQPWKTQQRTRQILDEMYAPTPEGIVGNEDCGQMSAWYIMSSMGLYAVAPGSGEFSLTTPLFEKATIALTNGNTLTITANSPDKNLYIDSVLFNGELVEQNYITYEEIMEGGVLEFRLCATPNMSRGASLDAAPHSMSSAQRVSIPYTTSRAALFEDEVYFDLGTRTAGAQIHYTLDGKEPTESSPLYTEPIRLTRTTTIKAKGFAAGMQSSATYKMVAQRAKFAKSKTLRAPKAGVHYECYLGKFSAVEQIKSGEFLCRDVMAEPTLTYAPREDHYGYVFSGYIKVDTRGIWQFMTKSDDGSVLYINDEVVVDNNGSHAAIEATGDVALEAGYHSFTLYYFEDYEGQALEWGWRAPGSDAIVAIPASALFVK